MSFSSFIYMYTFYGKGASGVSSTSCWCILTMPSGVTHTRAHKRTHARTHARTLSLRLLCGFCFDKACPHPSPDSSRGINQFGPSCSLSNQTNPGAPGSKGTRAMRNSCRRQTHLNTTLKQQTCSPATDPAFISQIGLPNKSFQTVRSDVGPTYIQTQIPCQSQNVLMLKPKSKTQQYSVFIGLQYAIVNSIFIHYQCLISSSSGGQTKYYMLFYLTFML